MYIDIKYDNLDNLDKPFALKNATKKFGFRQFW